MSRIIKKFYYQADQAKDIASLPTKKHHDSVGHDKAPSISDRTHELSASSYSAVRPLQKGSLVLLIFLCWRKSDQKVSP